MKKCESCIAWGFRSDADMWQDNPECLFFGLGGEDSCEFTEDDTKAILRGAKNTDLVLVAVTEEQKEIIGKAQELCFSCDGTGRQGTVWTNDEGPCEECDGTGIENAVKLVLKTRESQ